MRLGLEFGLGLALRVNFSVGVVFEPLISHLLYDRRFDQVDHQHQICPPTRRHHIYLPIPSASNSSRTASSSGQLPRASSGHLMRCPASSSSPENPMLRPSIQVKRLVFKIPPNLYEAAFAKATSAYRPEQFTTHLIYKRAYILERVLPKMYFRKCTSENVLPKMYFRKCTSENVLPKCTSENELPKMNFRK